MRKILKFRQILKLFLLQKERFHARFVLIRLDRHERSSGSHLHVLWVMGHATAPQWMLLRWWQTMLLHWQHGAWILFFHPYPYRALGWTSRKYRFLMWPDYRAYRVSPITRPSVIFEDDFNINPALKISPSWLETDDLQDIPEGDDMMFLNKLLLTSFWIKNMLMISKCR